jgi:nucleoside-diphosphate-sugar epimerase
VKILLTGHTGFLGSYLKREMLGEGMDIVSLGRGKDSDWHFDLRSDLNDFPEGDGSLGEASVDLVIHAAGLAHCVPKTALEKQSFFEYNLKGTKRLLWALKASGNMPKQFLFISTVAVYGDPFDCEKAVPPFPSRAEAEQLSLTSYAWSKWEAEEAVRIWCAVERVKAVIWRLPLIIGEGAPGNLGAMERGIQKGYYYRIGNSYARMRFYVNLEQLGLRVLDLLEGRDADSGTFNVISGEKSYGDFEDEIALKYGKKLRNIPLWIAWLAAKVGDMVPGFPLNSYRLKKLLGE